MYKFFFKDRFMRKMKQKLEKWKKVIYFHLQLKQSS